MIIVNNIDYKCNGKFDNKTLSKVAMLIEGVINTNKILIRIHKNLDGFIECGEFLRTIIDYY